MPWPATCPARGPGIDADTLEAVRDYFASERPALTAGAATVAATRDAGLQEHVDLNAAGCPAAPLQVEAEYSEGAAQPPASVSR